MFQNVNADDEEQKNDDMLRNIFFNWPTNKIIIEIGKKLHSLLVLDQHKNVLIILEI